MQHQGTVPDNLSHSTGSKIVGCVAGLFYLITSLVLLAVFAAEAGWAKLTGKDESP